MAKTIKVNMDESLEITVVKEEVEVSDLGHLRTLLNQLKFDKEKTLGEQQNYLDKLAATAGTYDAKISEMEATINDVENQVAALNNFPTYTEYKADKDAKLAAEETAKIAAEKAKEENLII